MQQKDSPGESMETHSNILAWRIPMNREACWAKVHVITKSQIQVSDSAQHSTAQWVKTANIHCLLFYFSINQSIVDLKCCVNYSKVSQLSVHFSHSVVSGSLQPHGL